MKMRGFSFLKEYDGGLLLETVELAADRLPHDVRASLFHQRRFQERIVSLAAHSADLNSCDDRVETLRQVQAALDMHHHVFEALNWVRFRGNEAVHDFGPRPDAALARGGLKRCHDIARSSRDPVTIQIPSSCPSQASELLRAAI
jgi:hypothetical protein